VPGGGGGWNRSENGVAVLMIVVYMQARVWVAGIPCSVLWGTSLI
jgi:hypothetical protein